MRHALLTALVILAALAACGCRTSQGTLVGEAMAGTPNAQTPVLVHSMNISEARHIPPLLPRCRMCSFAELRERHAEGELLATVVELTDRESLGR
jgi:outer membrane PBP1 activator LpoA protein